MPYSKGVAARFKETPDDVLMTLVYTSAVYIIISGSLTSHAGEDQWGHHPRELDQWEVLSRALTLWAVSKDARCGHCFSWNKHVVSKIGSMIKFDNLGREWKACFSQLFTVTIVCEGCIIFHLWLISCKKRLQGLQSLILVSTHTKTNTLSDYPCCTSTHRIK